MRLFARNELRAAREYAAAGGQSLHTHRVIPDRARAPRCFVAAVDRGESIGHLFDRDAERLRRTARSLGVKVIVVHREGQPGQHIDLCSAPLRKAAGQCENPNPKGVAGAS